MTVNTTLIFDLLNQIEGENPLREGLRLTPSRVSMAWEEWTCGYGQDPADVLATFADGAEDVDELVFQGAIPFWSTCEHHLAPFFGIAHIGYLPNGRVVGLSKLQRLLQIYARRLTIQERIGTQVAAALEQHLQPRGVGVVLQCRHSCMESRGINKAGSITMTSALRGLFKTAPDARAEFLGFVQAASQGLKTL